MIINVLDYITPFKYRAAIYETPEIIGLIKDNPDAKSDTLSQLTGISEYIIDKIKRRQGIKPNTKPYFNAGLELRMYNDKHGWKYDRF